MCVNFPVKLFPYKLQEYDCQDYPWQSRLPLAVWQWKEGYPRARQGAQEEDPCHRRGAEGGKEGPGRDQWQPLLTKAEERGKEGGTGMRGNKINQTLTRRGQADAAIISKPEGY